MIKLGKWLLKNKDVRKSTNSYISAWSFQNQVLMKAHTSEYSPLFESII